MTANLSKRGKRILIPIALLAFVNFAAFFVIAVSIGGDAVNGRIENGRYFVSNHGVATEVSSAVYWYSYIHVLTVFCTHGLTVLAVLLLIACGDFSLPDGRRRDC